MLPTDEVSSTFFLGSRIVNFIHNVVYLFGGGMFLSSKTGSCISKLIYHSICPEFLALLLSPCTDKMLMFCIWFFSYVYGTNRVKIIPTNISQIQHQNDVSLTLCQLYVAFHLNDQLLAVLVLIRIERTPFTFWKGQIFILFWNTVPMVHCCYSECRGNAPWGLGWLFSEPKPW